MLGIEYRGTGACGQSRCRYSSLGCCGGQGLFLNLGIAGISHCQRPGGISDRLPFSILLLQEYCS